jgi:hypothetical protein
MGEGMKGVGGGRTILATELQNHRTTEPASHPPYSPILQETREEESERAVSTE